MEEQKIRYDDIVVELYKNHRGEMEINISNDCEDITLTIAQARYLAIILLGMRKELSEKE